MITNKRIMLVVAHPDDELLGCGATMHKLINEFNCKIHLVILGEGLTSRTAQRDVKKWQKELNTHRQNIKKAQKTIGYHSVSINDFPDNRFDTVALLDIIKVIEREKVIFKPEVIFTHHYGDINIDHRRTFDAVITSCRPLAQETVKTIISFETPSSTEWIASTDKKQFIPNIFFEIKDKNLNAKICAMELYQFEKRDFPHPRSPEALKIQAQRWGVSIGCSYAEAFCLVRWINNAY